MSLASRVVDLAVSMGGAVKAQRLRSDRLFSRGGANLITNGNGSLGNATNFPQAVFSGADVPPGARGSFVYSATTVFTEETFPVNPNRVYDLSFEMRQSQGSIEARFYSMLSPLDAYGNTIVPQDYMGRPGTLTTLAADLKPGDTVMVLTSAANWTVAPGEAAHRRSAIFWDYVDPGGKLWAPNTYSKNWVTDLYVTASGSPVTGNTIALRVPWAGPLKPAGTALSNGSSGGVYMYIGASNLIAPTVWTPYSGRTEKGAHPGGILSEATTRFPTATAAARLGFLPNRQGASGSPGPESRQAYANINVIDVTEADDLRRLTDAPFITALASAITNPASSIRNAVLATARSDSGQTSIVPASGWAAESGNPAGYRILNGVVHLRGLMTRSAGEMSAGTPYTVGVLPAGARPQVERHFPITMTGLMGMGLVTGQLTVQTDGTMLVTPISGTAHTARLSGDFIAA